MNVHSEDQQTTDTAVRGTLVELIQTRTNTYLPPSLIRMYLAMIDQYHPHFLSELLDKLNTSTPERSQAILEEMEHSLEGLEQKHIPVVEEPEYRMSIREIVNKVLAA